MKTSHEENIEAAENDLVALREELVRLELERRYPIPGCDRLAWDSWKRDEIARVQKSIALRQAALSEWAQQLNLSFSDAGF